VIWNNTLIAWTYVDNAIHWIFHYLADSIVLLTLIDWIAIYPVDSIVAFEQLGPDRNFADLIWNCIVSLAFLLPLLPL